MAVADKLAEKRLSVRLKTSKRAVGRGPLAVQSNFAVTEKQFEKIESCLKNPPKPTESIIRARQALLELVKAYKN